MKKLSVLILALSLFSCESNKEDTNQIVTEAIEVAGGNEINNTEIEFVFRDIEYGAMHKDGLYEYVRIFKDDSSNVVRDELTNDGFKREINGKQVEVTDSMTAKYSNSVNSVIYFALLPIGLNDAAVNKTYLGEKEMKGKLYHKVKVTFDEEGGGQDHEDEFIYWINKETSKVDYLAYEYHTEGGGMRFREAYNERYVEGVRFVDYINYKPKSDIELAKIDEAYLSDNLEEVSKIELENIRVNQAD